MSHPIISADSHITEPPNTYLDYIDRKWRDKAPRMEYSELVAAAGKPAEEIRIKGVRFDEMHRGGWDPEPRMAEQERDGVQAEAILGGTAAELYGIDLAAFQ
ncbi:MAG: hypothetical protein ACYTGK_20440 [Planctomycetota bacterium]|jgi:hypothetical protein